jgi:hypothetical protein
MNLKAFARMAWNGVELAGHEVTQVLAYAEKLVAARPQILELASVVGLGPEAKLLLGGIELTAEEIDKIATLAKTFASQKDPGKTPAPQGAPPAPSEPSG